MRLAEEKQYCKEWVEEKANRCGERAVVMFWGKLFDPEALGPRCDEHATKHLNGRYWKHLIADGWAIMDLTDLYHVRND